MPQTLDHLLLRLSNAISHIPAGELPRETWLRGGKAAELATALAAAVGVNGEALHRARVLYPFFYFLGGEFSQVRGDLPAALRGGWDKLRDGSLIAGADDLTLWRACVETAWAAFDLAHAPQHLPNASVQVTVSQGRPVLLTPLNLPNDKLHIADALQGRVECGVRTRQPGIGDRVLLCGHFDPHGLAMLAATWLHLRSQGAKQVQAVCGYTETGDYGKFWKRTLPKLVAGGSFTHVVIVDITVYAREHSRTIDALKKAAGASAKVHLVDHHLDTLGSVHEMAQAGAEVVLTDIPGCFYGDASSAANLPYSILGGIGDRDLALSVWMDEGGAPELAGDVQGAYEAASSLMNALSPPPAEMKNLPLFPLESLLDAAGSDFPAFAAQLKGYAQKGFAVDIPGAEKPERLWFTPPPVKNDAPPVKALPLGEVLLVQEQIESAGREWYAALEKLLAANPQAHYALCGRYLTGAGFNFLCLKRWREFGVPAPLAFVPEDERAQTLGHYGAFWFNIADASEAERRLSDYIKAVNGYFGVTGGRVAAAVRKTILKLVDTRAEGTRVKRTSADRMF